MQITNETVEVLWLGAGAVALWMVLPAVLSALGLTIQRSVIDDDAGALEPTGNDAEYEDLFAQLRRLGFEPVGRRSTTCWFFLIYWCRNYQSRIFANRKGDVIATVYKLWAWDRWRLSFVTAFSDKAIVETSNQMAHLRIEEPDRLRWGLATPDRALLLERHREACRDFAAAGSRCVAVLPAGEVSRLILHHESRYHRRHNWWVGLAYMTIPLVCLGIGLLPVLLFAGTASYLLPVSIIAWGLLWPAVETLLFRAAERRSRAEDASRQCDQPTPRPDGGAIVESLKDS